MLPAKYLTAVAILSIPAYSFSQDKIKIEPKWEKDFKQKMTFKASLEAGGLHATLNATLLWEAKDIDDSGYTLSIHHDDVKVNVQDQDTSAPAEDYKIIVNKKGELTKVAGGIDGTDATRWYLASHFFTPSESLSKNQTAKWTVSGDRLFVGELNVESTYLGEEKVGNVQAYRFKQKLSEAKTSFTSSGMIWVTLDGHVVKADVSFAEMPLPVSGGNATGKFTISTVE
jgi:hypothetical protein